MYKRLYYVPCALNEYYCSHFEVKRKFTSQGKTKTTGGKANESDEYIITNTPEATTTFPGRALLRKKFGAHFDFVSELSLIF